jgi:hypothetical protein
VGLDVVFPAAMAGLAVALVAGRREVVAALAGAVLAVAISLAWDPAAGIVAGGLVGPLVGMAVPAGPRARRLPEAPVPFGTRELGRRVMDEETGAPPGADRP